MIPMTRLRCPSRHYNIVRLSFAIEVCYLIRRGVSPQMFSFDKSVIEVACPRCKFPNAVTVREARFGLTIPCRGCKRNIRLVPMDGGLAKVKRVLDDFITGFPKNISIKI